MASIPLELSPPLPPSEPHRKTTLWEGDGLISHSLLPMAAVSISATGALSASTFHGDWTKSFTGDPPLLLGAWRRVPLVLKKGPRMMGNVNEGKGIFAPLVVVTRNIVGKKRFNQLRGKAIALHSQVITEFCKSIGADGKQRQGLIRLAKKNGEKLGFLA